MASFTVTFKDDKGKVTTLLNEEVKPQPSSTGKSITLVTTGYGVPTIGQYQGKVITVQLAARVSPH